MNNIRCSWVGEHPLMITYHDKEWGQNVEDDEILFEYLTLEGAQAGLSWETVLRKRESYKKAFDNWNISAIANYSLNDIERLMNTSGIIRHRLKIISAITNAKATIQIQKEFGSFRNYLDSLFRQNTFITHSTQPTSVASDTLSKNLKKRGYRFVGSIICQSYLQAIGIINGHERNCFKHT